MNLLLVETDSVNAQMLLGGLLLAVQDSAACEECELVTQPDCSSNVFSSGFYVYYLCSFIFLWL